MLVWRIEHKDDGIGPYAGLRDERIVNARSRFCRALVKSHLKDPDRPMPRISGRVLFWQFTFRFFRFGFASLEEGKAWFAGHMQDLDKHGYIWATYEVPDRAAQVQDGQVIFLKSRAKLLRRWRTIV